MHGRVVDSLNGPENMTINIDYKAPWKGEDVAKNFPLRLLLMLVKVLLNV